MKNNYKINSKSITITIGNHFDKTEDAKKYTEALLTLIGYYNKYGKNITVEKYKELALIFNNNLSNTIYYLNK